MTNTQLQIRIASDHFPCDHLEIARLAGRERISELFAFDIDVVADAANSPERGELAGAEASLVFERDGQEVRRMHGMIARATEALDGEGETRQFQLRFVPRAHRLSLVENQEIFMDMTATGLFQKLFELVELGDGLETDVLSEQKKAEFLVQYKETDLAFLSRTAEHRGISFFFRHDDGKDVLVFKDGQRYPRVPGRPSVPLRGRGEHRDVFALSVETNLIPMTYAVVDYNYRNPLLDLTAAYDSPHGFAGGVAEYGTHVKSPTEAAAYAKMRAEERESTREVYVGKSDVCELTAGHTVEIEGGKREDVELLITEVEHRATFTTRMHGGDAKSHYENSFRGISAELTYRPPRTTPKPRISGIVNGIIDQPEGASTKYARIDRHGRYRVRFAFDTAAPGERRASRPVRMAQPSAGAGMGMHFPLRPGTEVLIAFVDGDPDRPIILSAIPNAVTPSPVTAGNSLKNQIKTASGVLLEIKDS